MPTLTMPEAERKPTGLVRGQAAKIARIHRVSITYVLRCAREDRGRPAILKTIDEYRQRNALSADQYTRVQ
jgi:hypothetical protein